MSIKQFEDIIAWQKAKALTARVYQLTRNGAMARDFGFSGQLQRAAVSIMSNIAEGFERRAGRQFRHLLLVSKASCAEVRSLLYVAKDVGYLSEPEFQALMRDAGEISRLLSGLMRSIRDDPATPRRRTESDGDSSHSELGTRNSELQERRRPRA